MTEPQHHAVLYTCMIMIMTDVCAGNCYRCLSIHQKHANVLQYKESRCLLHYNPRTYQVIQ